MTGNQAAIADYDQIIFLIFSVEADVANYLIVSFILCHDQVTQLC